MDSGDRCIYVERERERERENYLLVLFPEIFSPA